MPRKAKPKDEKYTVCRVQDGSLVRSELSYDEAQEECSVLNAQARQIVGTGPHGAIYASMFHGDVSRYEIRSERGLVLA